MPVARQLGRYQLLDRIAVGGMAEVYRAKTFDSKGREHIIAIKRMRSHVVDDADIMRSLIDEAKLAASLRHPNISRVYELGHAGNEYFLAMEWVDGKDARALCERARATATPVPPEHVAFIGLEIAAALAVAHAHRDANGHHLEIVHRDVSPSNVLISYAGEVKLCDFGIAKVRLQGEATRTGIIKGKVKYMSPEQAQGKKLDHRSDLFSLGSVMYEMLTLRQPFVGKGEVDVVLAVRAARMESLRSVNPGLPGELCEIVERLMSKSRSRRYQSGQELAAALRGFLAQAKPGYKRSVLSRFMRNLFADEIERELRVLEAYVIESFDGESAENLLADAMPRNATYKQFHADPTGRRQAAGRDLHAENTRILEQRMDSRHRASVPPPPRKHAAPELRRATGIAELHSVPTRILPRIDEARRSKEATSAATMRGPAEGAALPSVIVDFGSSVHEVQTQLLPRIDTPTEPFPRAAAKVDEPDADEQTDTRPRRR